MNARKSIAVFVVLVMALSATACMVSFDDSKAANLEDQGTITLDVDTGYEGDNVTNLAKLGLTGASSWEFVDHGTYKGYQMTLKNVIYETSEPIALKVKSTAGKVLYIKCEGVNKMVCKGMDNKGNTTCIDAYNIETNNSTGVCFVGSGEFTAECDNKDSQNSVAIYASLFGVSGCTLHAKTSDIEISEVLRGNVTTAGIVVMNGMKISDGANVYAQPGNITSTDTSTPQYASSGVTSYNEWSGVTAIIDGSCLYATGGNLNLSMANVAGSIGGYFCGGVMIRDSILEFRSGNADVGFSGSLTSEALSFNSMFNSTGSYITAISGDISMAEASIERGEIFSVGIKNKADGNTMTMENTYMIAQGGNLSCEQSVGTRLFFSAGMINATKTEFSVTLKSSLWGTFGGNDSEYSYGFVIMDPSTMTIASGGSLTLDDSEFNASGKTRALAIGSITCVNPDNVKWCGYEKNGKWTVAEPSALPGIKDATSVFVGYNSLVYIRASEDEQAEIDVELVSGDSYTLPKCEFTAPAGKQFKCWSVDGTEYEPGQSIVMDYPYKIVTAVWEDVPESGGNNIGVIALAVIFGLAALAILLLIYIPSRK